MVTQEQELGLLAVIDLGIQIFLGFVAIALKTEKFLDLASGSTFLLLAIVAIVLHQNGSWDNVSIRQWANVIMIGIWAIRWSAFLFWRVLKAGEDSRFREAKENPIKFLTYWIVQAVWVFLTGLAVYITNVRSDDSDRIDTSMVVGWCVFAFGFIFEVTADVQKTKWRAKPENKGMWIDVGLWSICQHPNYAGEMLVWWGIYIANVSSFVGWENVGILSPLFTFTLIRFVSGIPLLQVRAREKWGKNPEWRRYHTTTPFYLFFLKPCMRYKSCNSGDYVDIGDP